MLAPLEIPVETVSRALALARETGARAVVTLAPAQPVPDATRYRWARYSARYGRAGYSAR